VLINVDDGQWWKAKIRHKSYDAGILHKLAMAVVKKSITAIHHGQYLTTLI